MEDLFYFRKELDHLQKTREFLVEKYPKLAHFLAHNSNDPDVERIIESLAVLTAKINKELDSNIPYIAESLINILAPNYTNSLPSFCIQEFELKNNAKENKILIPKNSSIKSALIGGIKCEFKTIYDVCVHPLKISDVAIGSEGKYHTLTLDISITKADTTFLDLDLEYLNFYLGNEAITSNTLLLWFLQYTKDIVLFSYDTDESFKLPMESLKPVGFESHENLFDNNDIGFSSFVLLQELFFASEKFHFVKLDNLHLTKTLQTSKIAIKFIFSKDLPGSCLPRANHFSLFASPVLNIFSTQAEPILLDHSRNGYRIFVDRGNPQAYSVIQILKVKAHSSDTGRRVLKNYHSFEQFEFLDKNKDFFSLANKKDSSGECYKEITFYSTQHDKETISIDILCSNNNLPSAIKIGGLNEMVGYQDITTSNITIPTQIKHVDINSQTAWNLVSILSFSYQTMLDRKSFLTIVHTYTSMFGTQETDFFSVLANALVDIKSQTIYRINGFITQRGILSEMHIDDSQFYCLGEVYKLGLVFSHFFTSFASINSFCELHIVCTASNTTFVYPVIYGNKDIL